MALGDQSKALIIMSKNKGWDPNVIRGRTSPEGKVYPDHNIEGFNKAPTLYVDGDICVGQLPQEIPANQQMFPDATGPVLTQETSFNSPDVSRENANRRTSGADPTPSMPGA